MVLSAASCCCTPVLTQKKKQSETHPLASEGSPRPKTGALPGILLRPTPTAVLREGGSASYGSESRGEKQSVSLPSSHVLAGVCPDSRGQTRMRRDYGSCPTQVFIQDGRGSLQDVLRRDFPGDTAAISALVITITGAVTRSRPPATSPEVERKRYQRPPTIRVHSG